MLSGNFYAVARIAERELGTSFIGSGPVPVITDIIVDNNIMNITINAENNNKIDWISNGKIIAHGNTIMLESHKNRLGSYIRANIIGPGGIVFTQPFGINWLVTTK